MLASSFYHIEWEIETSNTYLRLEVKAATRYV